LEPYRFSWLRLTVRWSLLSSSSRLVKSDLGLESSTLATGWDIFSDQISPGGLMNYLQKHTIDRFA
jgi:hypothetical protein